MAVRESLIGIEACRVSTFPRRVAQRPVPSRPCLAAVAAPLWPLLPNLLITAADHVQGESTGGTSRSQGWVENRGPPPLETP